MAFDFESAARGAQAGNAVYPGYGAIAGFVIGGFVGGHKASKEKKKLKKKRRRYEREFKKLLSPSYGAQLQSGFVPGFRNTVAQGIGPTLQADVATRLSRHGLTGTGLGEALYGLGQVAPDIVANRMAGEAAGALWDKQIAAFEAKARSENIGWPGGPGYQRPDPFGSAGAAVDVIGSFGPNSFSGKGLLGGGGFKNPYIGRGPGPDISSRVGPGGWQMPSSYISPMPGSSSFAQQYSGPFQYQYQPRYPYYGSR